MEINVCVNFVLNTNGLLLRKKGCYDCLSKHIRNDHHILDWENYKSKRNVLHYLCMNGHSVELEYVLDMMKLFNIDWSFFEKKDHKDEFSRHTPLWYAIKNEHRDCTKVMLNHIDVSTSTILCDIAGYRDMFKYAIDDLVHAGIDVNFSKPFHDTPLCIETYRQHPDNVKKLIKLGADVNKKGFGGRTPLHYACGLVDDYGDGGQYNFGNVNLVKLLLKCGADMYIKNNLGETPLDMTINPKIIKKLKKHERSALDVKEPDM